MKGADKMKMADSLIHIVSLIVAGVVGHYWFHWSDTLVMFIMVLVIGHHELDKITDKLDAIAESVESLKE